MAASYESIILHVGLHKTGSTTIQQVSAGPLREFLSDHGIAYGPFSYGDKELSNHGGVVTAALFEPLDRYNANWRAGLIDDPHTIKASFATQFDKVLREPLAPHLLLSGELFSAYLRMDMVTLRDRLSEHCETLRTVAYVRNPASFYGSLLQEGIKGGHPDNVAGLDGLMSTRYANLVEVFGETLEVFDFDEHVATRNGLVGAFFSELGIEEDSLVEIDNPSLNTRASLEACKIMRAINNAYPQQVDGERSSVRTPRDLVPLHSLPGGRFSVNEYRGTPIFENVLNELDWYATTFPNAASTSLPEATQDDWGSETLEALEEHLCRLEDARLRRAGCDLLIEEAERIGSNRRRPARKLRTIAKRVRAKSR